MADEPIMLTRRFTEPLTALVAISARVPDDAMTAGLLGTERAGHGIVIREDGLIVTIGYLISEAEDVWISAIDGSTVPGYVVGYDYESGLGLVKPTMPLAAAIMNLGRASDLSVGDAAIIAGSGGEQDISEVRIIAKQQFAGRWEYVVDDAIFTAPAHQNWAGTALIDQQGRLCGVGSLLIQDQRGLEGHDTAANMFVPIDLLLPYIDEICQYGGRNQPPRPWLGALVQDDEGQLIIVGLYRNCPADEAGLAPGDIILEVDGRAVSDLAGCFKRMWSLGEAGVEIGITVLRGTKTERFNVITGDRNTFHRRGSIN